MPSILDSENFPSNFSYKEEDRERKGKGKVAYEQEIDDLNSFFSVKLLFEIQRNERCLLDNPS